MDTDHREKSANDKSGLILSLPIPLLILAGIILSLIQVQQSQQLVTTATYRLTNCDVTNADMAIKPSEQKMLTDINTYRSQQAGAPPLAMDTNLKRAAQWHANDMNAKIYLEFIDSLGRNPAQRINNCGFTNNTLTATSIQQGNPNPEVALAVWKGEQGDNTNMLNPAFTSVGIALAGPYWVAAYAGNVQASPTAPAGSTTQNPTQNPEDEETEEEEEETEAEETEPTATPIPPQAINMRITVSVKIPAIGNGGNLFPKHLSRRVLVTLFDVENKEVKKGTGFLTYDRTDLFTGTINLGSMYEGKYFVKVTVQEQVLPDVIRSVTLQSTVQPPFQQLLANTNNVLPPVTLIQGDLDSDNKLTPNDFKLALVCFQTKGCVRDPALGDTYNMIDFNDDGKVNVTDYNVLLRSYFEARGD